MRSTARSTYSSAHETPTNYTVGVNYTVSPNLSVYGRYERGYQTQGVNPHATALILYEAGVTFGDYGLIGTLRGFRTLFDNQSFGGGVDPANPTWTWDFSATRPPTASTWMRPTGPSSSRCRRSRCTSRRPTRARRSTTHRSAISTSMARTSLRGRRLLQWEDTSQHSQPDVHDHPQYDLPAHYGQVYLRYMHIGRIFADNGDQVELPAYGVLGIGAICNITAETQAERQRGQHHQCLGLTEGNPRQGFTQSIVNGYFYGRGIVGPTALVSLTYKF
jgi:iron complex outermembrane receptor protein